MFRIALKNILARKFRLISSGIAVILGVGFMAGGLVLTDTINQTFDVLFADVFEGTDAMVRSSEKIEADFGGTFRGRVPGALVEEVRAVDGVARAEGNVFQPGARVLDADGDPVGALRGPPRFGTNWFEDEDLNAWRIIEGHAPSEEGEVVLDKVTAEVGGLEVGSRTTVVTPGGTEPVTVVGIARFQGVDTAGGAGFVFFVTPQAQRLMGAADTFDSISIVAEEGLSEAEVTAALAAALPDYEAVTGAEITKENQDQIKQSLSFFGTFLTVFAGISLFVGIFIINNTFSILVAQRRREMALLRALGASSRQVLGTLMAEALLVGIVASLLGIAAGILMAGGLKLLLDAFGLQLPASGVVVSMSTVVISLVVGVVVTVVAAFLPARRGGKIPPIAALRESAVDSTGVSRSRIAVSLGITFVGAVLLAAGLFGDGGLEAIGFGAAVTFIGVTTLGPVVARPVTRLLGLPFARLRGVSGVLARENAMRNPKRTARTASALLIGVALVAFIAIVTTSVKESFVKVITTQFTGDLVVGGGGGGPGAGFTTEIGTRLAEVEELDLVAPLRFSPARIDDEDSFVAAIDAAAGADLFQLELLDGDLDELGEDGLAVTEDRADREGWEVGDEVTVTFTEGGPRTMTVEAVFDSPSQANPLTPMFFDLAALDATGAPQSDQQVFVTVADGVDLAEARAKVETVLDDFPTAEVQDREEFAEGATGQIDVLIALIYVFLALSVLIALFGIANTLVLSVLERTRELGLLRAVGMTRNQLRSAVRYEAVIVALFGTLGGLGVGLFFAWSVMQALAEDGFDVFRVPIGQLVVITLVAAVSGVLAAIVPARRAARLDILKAIATD